MRFQKLKILKNFFFLFVFLIFFQVKADGNLILFNEFQFKEASFQENFLNELKILCKIKGFYNNLKNHKTYPMFGTVQIWGKKCEKLNNNVISPEKFFRRNFKLFYYEIKNKGILTGYYEPIIKISKHKDVNYKFPLLKKNPKLKLERKKILENYTTGDVLYWTSNNIDLFFLQIQGSGIGEFPNGEKVKLLYDGNNGEKYTSIGKVLIKEGYLNKNKVSLFTIKEWLTSNPMEVDRILFMNKRYIFFKSDKYINKNAVGAMGRSLIPNVSLAIDKDFYPLGIPMLLKIDFGSGIKTAISHDTGAAIKGKHRADLYIGQGEQAEKIAGNLKKPLQLYVLVPYN